MLFLESNTLAPILKKLERMGYLRRQRNSADERQVEDDRWPARGAGANCRNLYSQQ
jgi:MarR family transcriptional regulator, organic hydroperoxide resistance regulator